MEATNLSRDVHELFHGKPEENQRIYSKIREKKEKQINNFVKEHESAPLQRSDEWFLIRNNVIGASELAALVGMSPYQNFDGLARKKEAKATHHVGGVKYSKMSQLNTRRVNFLQKSAAQTSV